MPGIEADADADHQAGLHKQTESDPNSHDLFVFASGPIDSFTIHSIYEEQYLSVASRPFVGIAASRHDKVSRHIRISGIFDFLVCSRPDGRSKTTRDYVLDSASARTGRSRPPRHKPGL